jgi:hypothetical protein
LHNNACIESGFASPAWLGIEPLPQLNDEGGTVERSARRCTSCCPSEQTDAMAGSTGAADLAQEHRPDP